MSPVMVSLGLPGGSVVKNPPAHAGDTGDTGSIPGSGRSPGEGNGNPLQYFCLEIPMDGEAWWATVRGGRKEPDTTERLSTFTRTCIHKAELSGFRSWAKNCVLISLFVAFSKREGLYHVFMHEI